MVWIYNKTNRLCKPKTTKPIIALGLISEIGHTFYRSCNEIFKAHEIPPEMVINIDQTSLPFILISKYTLEKKSYVKSICCGCSRLSSDHSHLRHNNGWKFLPISINLSWKNTVESAQVKISKIILCYPNP